MIAPVQGASLGFRGRIGPELLIVLAVAIYFVIHVPLSRWWLNRFALGPTECLWRVLTYGRASLRAVASGAPAAV